jgi:hypothetical protein
LFGIKRRDLQVHEVSPVKFGGSPTDPTNKVLIPKEMHSQASKFWQDLKKFIEPANKDGAEK